MLRTEIAEEIFDAAPDFRCGDELLTRVYRDRWVSFANNIVRVRGHGWLVTEFHQPGPGRAHGTVNAAAGHHIAEGRWLARSDVIGDYIRYWYGSPEAEPHRYTEWIAWASKEYARLHAAWDSVAKVLPGMIANYDAWAADSLHPSGLYWAHDLTDAMEFSISGDGFRPTINSYQYGNARAIGEIARWADQRETADLFNRTAAVLRARVLAHLYDPELETFATIPLSPDGEDAYAATAAAERRMPPHYRDLPLPRRSGRDRHVRELIGFVPWYFGLPGDAVDPGPAVAQLTDPDGFAAPYGLRTAERRHHRYEFKVRSTSPRFLCRWNGPSWPFATSQTLTSLARILRSDADVRQPSSFLELLRQYASAHIEPDGSYWLDEDLDPETGAWRVREWRLANDPARAEIGRDYQHSTFADLILSGLLGIDVDGAEVVVDPLACAADLGWFEVRGLRLADAGVTVAWSREEGMRLSTTKGTAHRSNLGSLRMLL